ncbi:DUF2244 domain-containing protein [Salinarimonas sp.]|uniref:DUF2244 domain-containing protein n=1 Tax=Salinarimonas sp. TaxID=2766526 RepID=UPI0032D93875
MPHPNETDDPAPLFSAVITPHRSLAPSGARLVVVLCCLAAVGSSIPFIVLGAWPVAGFLGLDILALAIAFKASFRSAKSVEEVILSPVDLLLRRISHRGERSERRFNPLWTKLDREHDEDYGLMALALVSRGERVVIARELSPPERESFAEAFGEALARVKRGV